MSILRGCLYLALSAVVSWHLFLRRPDATPALPPAAPGVELAVAPAVLPPPAAVAPEAEEPAPPQAEPEPTPEPKPEPEPAPPPPERGDPDGDEDEKSSDPVPEDPAPPETHEERARREVERIRESEADVARAAEEVSGRTRRGFRTVLFSAAGDQLAIARYFGEQLVVVPRKGLDPRKPYYFVVDAAADGSVRRIDRKAPLDRFRQYRDFFAFEYSDLPGSVRALRRTVPVRSDIFLFAALIPPSEWAVVMARRADALARCRNELSGAPRTLDDLRRVELRYVALPGGAFDIEVKQLVFADGTRWTNNPQE